MFRFTVNRKSLSVEFETETIDAGRQILINGGEDLNRAFDDFEASHGGESGESEVSGGADEAGSEGKPKRTRRTKAQMAADKAAEAAGTQPELDKALQTLIPPAAPPAPPPMPVPSVDVPLAPIPVPAPAPAGTAGLEIPGFLDRTAKTPEQVAAVISAPVATPAAPPPPPAPAAPPATAIAQKVVAELKRRATGAPDDGKSIVDWLVAIGAVVKGATFEEAMSVILFLEPDKLAPIATALAVA